MNNINIFTPEWIVPKNIFALQTKRNNSVIKKSSQVNEIKLSTNFGLEFINKEEKGLNQSHSNISIELPSDERNADAAYTCLLYTSDAADE